MLTIDKPKDVFQHIGKELGPSDWLTVTQEMIDKFAEATGDHQWIHVDVERAKRELPGGKTIAHGYLTLSLLPRMAPTRSASSARFPPAHAYAFGSDSSMPRRRRKAACGSLAR